MKDENEAYGGMIWPPRGDPTVNQFLLPIAILFISRSATL
jgi:hypothetical protein